MKLPRIRLPRLRFLLLVLVSGTQASLAAEPEASSTQGMKGHYLPLIRNHFDRVLREGIDRYGPEKTGLWLASMDIHEGGQPENPDPAVKRTYRLIHAPRGSNLYWDQPYVVSAYHVGRLTGDDRYRDAADRYVRDFLDRCVSGRNGLFLWGNHLYYDVFTDKVVAFSGGPHEARPLPCAWEMFWAISPEATERTIRSMGIQHVKDRATGLFDRHADIEAIEPPAGPSGKEDPFLEAGGILAESLAWLSAKTGHDDPELRERALSVARYSFGQRDETTGLLRNQPGQKRWDYYVSTTEVGLWAGCLLRAAALTDETTFRTMARDAVDAYLHFGFEPGTDRVFGQLNVVDGSPRRPERTAGAGVDTIYQPGEYADLWEPLFPTHNYPMCLAESCLTLFEQTHDEAYKHAAERFARFIAIGTPANDGKGAYADQYGRCIHFLTRASRVLDDPRLLEQARGLAAEAITRLYSEEAGMFRSHPGEDRCDAVDGMGFLFLALISLETGNEPDMMGAGW